MKEFKLVMGVQYTSKIIMDIDCIQLFDDCVTFILIIVTTQLAWKVQLLKKSIGEESYLKY